MNKTIVIATGGFDPTHSGHISYLNSAKKLGDILIVGINTDDWLTRKKGKPFMCYRERFAIISNLKSVDSMVLFDDSDDTAIDAIRQVRMMYPTYKIIFANGGDRTKDNIPEMSFEDDNLEFVFGVGGDDKKNSSSKILKDWENEKI